MKKISIVDVAESLGVSKTLVSFVINGRGDEKGIKKETQQKVLDKIAEMGYHPNSFARSLRTGQSQTIGIVVADISNPFYAKLCRSIEDYANAYNYNVLMCSSDENPSKEENLINMLRDRQVDGIIISPTRDYPYELSDMHKNNFPLVLVDRKFNRYKLPSVVVQNQQIARSAVEHLIERGHRQIGLFCVSPVYTTVMSERMEGYKGALRGAGIRVKRDFIVEISFEDLRQQVRVELDRLLRKNPGISALFSLNNKLTSELIRACKSLGIRIPEDISIVSFDDIELFEMIEPPITAIRQPVEEMGRQAAQHLMSAIKSKEKIKECNLQLEAKLMIRESS